MRNDGQNWQQIAVELKKTLSWSEVFEKLYSDQNNSDWKLPDTKEGLRSSVRRYCKQHGIKLSAPLQDFAESGSIEYKKDGSVEILKTVANGKELTPAEILEAHGLKVSDWTVVSYKNNYWNALGAEGQKVVQCQSKITVKPVSADNSITFADIKEYFANFDYSSVIPESRFPRYVLGEETLEIDMPDLHNGLYAWGKETGENYDLHIARQRFCSCIADIVHRCQNRTFKKIALVMLGDLMHIDNDEQRTTKGTFQQSDGRTAKIFKTTLDMLIDAVSMLVQIAPVEVIYLRGNHDGTTGYMLAESLQMAFRNDPSIAVDTEPNPQKARLWGGNLIGFTHGEMAKTNMRGWLQQRFKKEFGLSNHVEIHAGHYHSEKTTEIKQTTDEQGIIVRHLPAICAASYYEHHAGYGSGEKAVVSYVWHDDKGLREIWHSSI